MLDEVLQLHTQTVGLGNKDVCRVTNVPQRVDEFPTHGKRQFSGGHLVHDDPQRPDVRGIRVVLAVDPLWTPSSHRIIHVRHRPDERLRELKCALQLFADSEISQLYLSKTVQQYVLGLQVPVNLMFD